MISGLANASPVASGGASRAEVIAFLKNITGLPLENADEAVTTIFQTLWAQIDTNKDGKISKQGK